MQTILRFPCGHILHAGCARDDKRSDWIASPQCGQCHESSSRSEPPDPDLEEGFYYVDHGNDPAYTKKLEKRFGRQGPQSENLYCKRYPCSKELPLSKKMRLFGNINIVTLKRTPDSIESLVSNKIGIGKCIQAGVTLAELVHIFGVKELKDLHRLYLKKNDLTNKEYFDTLLTEFRPSYSTLHENFDVDISWLAENAIGLDISHRALHWMGLMSYADLIEQGMTKRDMIAFGFPLVTWKSKLDFYKEGGILNGPITFNATDFRLLRWKHASLMTLFNLNAAEMKSLGIDNGPIVDPRRTPKRTAISGKKGRSSYDGLFNAP